MRELFERTPWRCITKGLFRGEGFAVDASLIKADANERVPRQLPGRSVGMISPARAARCARTPLDEGAGARPARPSRSASRAPIRWRVGPELPLLTPAKPSGMPSLAQPHHARPDAGSLRPAKLAPAAPTAQKLARRVHERGIESHIPVFNPSAATAPSAAPNLTMTDGRRRVPTRRSRPELQEACQAPAKWAADRGRVKDTSAIAWLTADFSGIRQLQTRVCAGRQSRAHSLHEVGDEGGQSSIEAFKHLYPGRNQLFGCRLCRREVGVCTMTTDTAFETIRRFGQAPSTAQFWMSSTPARNFSTLNECLLFLADATEGEPLPDVRVHAETGDIALNGPELEKLISAARLLRSLA